MANFSATRGKSPWIKKNFLLLDSDGRRAAVKYYYSDEWPTQSAKLAFEMSAFAKDKCLNRSGAFTADIAMFEDNIVVYRFFQDLHFYITGGDDDNDLILATLLQGFFDSVAVLLRGNVKIREALENLDLILLCFDEIVDEGIILYTRKSCKPLYRFCRAGNAALALHNITKESKME